VSPRTSHLDPVFDIPQTSARLSDRMTKRRLQITPSLGISCMLDVAQCSLHDYFAAVHARAWAKIDNVIGAPHRFLVVLDDDERVSFLPQGGERVEQTQIIARMQTDRRLIEHVKHAT